MKLKILRETFSEGIYFSINKKIIILIAIWAEIQWLPTPMKKQGPAGLPAGSYCITGMRHAI